MNHLDFLRRINIRCPEFVASGIPLYRELPAVIGDFKRVKVRFKKRLQDSPLNKAVGDRIADRCVVTSTKPQSYYVFVPDGYQAVWSPIQLSVDDEHTAPIRHGNIALAAVAQRDVLVYDISDYYVISTSMCEDYSTLLEAITSSTFAPTLSLTS